MYPNENSPVSFADLRNMLIVLSHSVRSTDMDVPVIDKKIAVSVPATSTNSSQPFTVYQNSIGGTYGCRLASVSIAVDAVFQTNFFWADFITGVTQPNPPLGPFDPTVNTFDEVPSGKFFVLKPGASIKITAINNVSTNLTNGIMSVNVVYDLITEGEYNLLQRYKELVGNI